MEKSKQPLVSVIMPAFNAAQYIEEAVRSVMNQTVPDWELFILDDCSSDDTAEIAARLAAEDQRITLIRNEKNMGVARARNRGFDLCRGAYVALIDSDDAWLPEKLEKQLQRLQETGADFSYCSYAIVGSDSKTVKPDYLVPGITTFDSLLRENTIGCSTVLLSREIVDKYRFETDFYHEDYVLWARLLQDGYRAAGCTEVLVNWRFIENSRSFNKKKAARNRWRIYRDYLKLPLGKRLWAFGGYATASLKKYYRKK